jgi:cytochrome c oxidase subunit 2
MTSFLVFTVLVLIGIAVWQLTKIYDLTQFGTASENSEVANDKDNSVNGYLMFAFVGFIYVFTIYSLSII